MYIPFYARVEQRMSPTTFIAAQIPAEYQGEDVILTSPSGQQQIMKAGSKPEYGSAGVEFLTYERAVEPDFYILQFANMVYTVHHPYGATIVVFEPAPGGHPIPPFDAVAAMPDVVEVPPLEDIEIVDLYGNHQDLAWLDTTYGFELTRVLVPEGVTRVCRIDKLVEVEGPAIYLVNVKDVDGMPMADIPVIRYWPDAPPLPEYDPPTSRWYDQGIFGPTNEYGDWACGIGSGDGGSAGTGVSAIWTAKPGVPSDLADKWLWLFSTEHRTLQVHFKIVPVEEQPGPDDEELLDVVKQIRDIVAGGYVVIPTALTQVIEKEA